jgi:hypothetical protein
MGQLGAQESRIELRDGSVITGELVSVGEGTYHIRTSTLGEIRVRDSDVLAIRPKGSGAVVSESAPIGQASLQELGIVQQQLLGDPKVMAAVLSLQSDPEIQAALSDPTFTRMILSGNIEALRTDQRFLRLMELPAIRAILGKVLDSP